MINRLQYEKEFFSLSKGEQRTKLYELIDQANMLKDTRRSLERSQKYNGELITEIEVYKQFNKENVKKLSMIEKANSINNEI